MDEDMNASELLVEQTEKRVKTEMLLLIKEEQDKQDEKGKQALKELEDKIKASLV